MSRWFVPDGPHDEDLWTCTQCALSPDPSWETLQDISAGMYHIGFDGRPCGPIVANPAQPAGCPA